MADNEPRDRYKYLENLAKEFMDFDDDPSDEEVSERFTELAGKYHPDQSDLPSDEANDMFNATTTSRDILKDNIEIGEVRKIRNGVSQLETALDSVQVADIKQDTIAGTGTDKTRTPSGVSSTGERANPADFAGMDFSAASKSEREEIIREIALGYSVRLRYNAVQGLLERGINEDQFYDAVNKYVDETGKGLLNNSDYYDAVEDMVRDQVGRQVFVNSIEKVENELAREYAPGAGIDEVAEIIASMVVQGHIDIGLGEFMVGHDNFRKPGTGNFRRTSGRNFRRPGDDQSNFRRM